MTPFVVVTGALFNPHHGTGHKVRATRRKRIQWWPSLVRKKTPK